MNTIPKLANGIGPGANIVWALRNAVRERANGIGSYANGIREYADGVGLVENGVRESPNGVGLRTKDGRWVAYTFDTRSSARQECLILPADVATQSTRLLDGRVIFLAVLSDNPSVPTQPRGVCCSTSVSTEIGLKRKSR